MRATYASVEEVLMDLENRIGETAKLRRPRFASLAPGLSKIMIAIVGTSLLIASAPRAQAQDSAPDAAVTACGNSIATCGCTITKSGFYQVTADLLSSQGMTAKNGCIDIKASKVNLNFGKPPPPHKRLPGFNLTGPGGMTPTGIGLHILKGSNGNFVELPVEADDWDVAILVQRNNHIV